MCIDFVAEGDDQRAEGPSTAVDGANILSKKATKSRAVGPLTMNDGPQACLCRFCRQRRRSTGRRPVYLRRWCQYFVAEGDQITGHRPVHYNRRAEGPSVHFSSPKAMIDGRRPVHNEDGPKARLCRCYSVLFIYVLFMSRLMHISAFCMSRRWTCLAPQALVYIYIYVRVRMPIRGELQS